MDDDNGLFNRQFLLTKEKCDSLGWSSVQVAEYLLYAHPQLELTSVSHGEVELFLLGFFVDYRCPERSNRDILQVLLRCTTFNELLSAIDELSGRFVLIYRSPTVLRILHDACGQREVFYDTSFSAFGSQPKIIEKVILGEEWTDPEAIEFYRSPAFFEARIFVGDTTHRSNIRRLVPNHYAEIRTRSVHRFFPVIQAQSTLNNAHVNDVAQQTVTILQGYLKAASLRYPLEIGVTAGYDSRVLFLAGKDLPCEFYVEKNNGKDNDTDVDVALKLGKVYHKTVNVQLWEKEDNEEMRRVHEASIDFPRYRQLRTRPSQRMIINGHLSEIARNFFGYKKNVTGVDLTYLYLYAGSSYPAGVFDSWINAHKSLFEQTRYHLLDLFYWEERMGNWGAKGKSEISLTREIYSPFCSRALLKLLLSTERKYRDRYLNILYDAILQHMSPIALEIPINPTMKMNAIRLMTLFGIYDVYKQCGMTIQRLKSRRRTRMGFVNRLPSEL